VKAEIISVGTELLLGQITDTNAAYLAQRLAEVGVDVYFKQTVGDNVARVQDTVRLAMSRADLIVMTGGLGPTEDDLTVAAVAGLLNLELIHHEVIADTIRRFFATRGRVPPDTVYKQALIPAGARPIPNTRGTAPGIHLDLTHTTIVISVPGLGDDMQAIKAGILEIADILVVNKADLPTAESVFKQLHIFMALDRNEGWQVPILKTVAHKSEGVQTLLETIDKHRAYLETSGRLEQMRRHRARRQLLAAAQAELMSELLAAAGANGRLEELTEAIAARELDPHTAAEKLIAQTDN